MQQGMEVTRSITEHVLKLQHSTHSKG